MDSPTSYFSLILFLSLLFLGACKTNQDKKAQEDIIALEKEVIRIHDEVMPKMADIARLMEILEKEADNTSFDSLVHQEIKQAMTKLDAGDSLMWEWMHNYKKPEDAPLDSIHSYLLTEKERISKTRDIMLEGIKNAESLIQKLGHGQPN